ncbi:MAG: hypothetical protein ABIP51_23200 [Bacteroidia bacterium]
MHKSIDKFINWVKENRNNPDITDEEFLSLIELSCLKFSGKVINVPFNVNSCPGWMDSFYVAEIKKIMLSGNKLEAVKKVKSDSKDQEVYGYTSWGLKECKDWCDELIKK